MLTDAEFIIDSNSNSLYYLRNLRDFSINIVLSFPKPNNYIKEYENILIECQNIGVNRLKYLKEIKESGKKYQIYYTDYTILLEQLTEKLFDLSLNTEITTKSKELPSELNKYDKEEIKKIDYYTKKEQELAQKFITLTKEVKKKIISNNLFSYTYPEQYEYMIRTITIYEQELSRLIKREKKDPIQVSNREYELNITTYQILTFLRGVINPAGSYLNQLDDLIINKYPELIESYLNIALTPLNQSLLRNKSIELIITVKEIVENMIKDLLAQKLYFIIEPLSLDTFNRNINYVYYILEQDIN